MKAVVKIGGKQHIVAEKETLLVDRLPDGTKELELDALMTFDDKTVKVGKPTVAAVKVSAKVIDAEIKGDKIKVIRYKAKKRVHTVNGHRQQYSRIQITSIE